MKIDTGGCGAMFAGVLVLIVVVALVAGAVMLSREMYDAQQERERVAAIVAQETTKQIEAQEEGKTERAKIEAEADEEERRDFVLALAAFTDGNITTVVILAAMLGAVAGIGGVRWLDRQVRRL